MKFKQVIQEEWFGKLQQRYLESKKTICPFCGHSLRRKYEGLVCQYNWCLLGSFKLGKGWVYLDGKKENNLNYFKDKYDFDIENFENKKKWLNLKNEVFWERGRKCEICDCEISLHIHHIIYRKNAPSLTFDKENLIILCVKCHTKIHSKDKRRWLHDTH